ncbi:MAG: tetratricopeptide repeat protein [Deltaproteobacteria bacterium]|nr:tetratricopeptide repeat protein [Deltaproteobacteria bacterium]
MGRFIGFRYEQGVVVLDTYSGEVVLVPPSGGSLQTLRAAVDSGSPVRLEILTDGAGGSSLLATPLAIPGMPEARALPAPAPEAPRMAAPRVEAPATPQSERTTVAPGAAPKEPPPPLAEDLAPPARPPAEDFEIETGEIVEAEEVVEEGLAAERPVAVPIEPRKASMPAEAPAKRPSTPSRADGAKEPSGPKEPSPPSVPPARALDAEPEPPRVEPLAKHEPEPPADEIPEAELDDVVDAPAESRPPEAAPRKPSEDFESSTAEIDPSLVASLRAASGGTPQAPGVPKRDSESPADIVRASLPPEIAAFDALFDKPPHEPIAVAEEAEVDLEVDEGASRGTAGASAQAGVQPDKEDRAEATPAANAPTDAREIDASSGPSSPAGPPKPEDSPSPPEAAAATIEAQVAEPKSEKPGRAPYAHKDRVLESFPFPIARSFEELQRATDADARLRWIIEASAGAIEIWATIAASEYFRSGLVIDELDEILIDELVRPSHTTWSKLLDRSIAHVEDRGLKLFKSEVVEAYRTLPKVGEKTPVEILVELATGRSNGSVPTAEQIDGAQTALESLLDALGFLAGVAIYHAIETGPHEPLTGNRFSGAHPAATSEPLSRVDFDMGTGEWFLRDEQSLETMPLLPFFAEQAAGKERELLLLAGYNRKSTVLRSVQGKTSDRPSRLRQVIARQPSPKTLEPRDVGFDRLFAAGEGVTNRSFDRLIKTRSVIPELLVARTDLASRLVELDRPEYRALYVSGPPGAGKTTAIQAHAAARLAAGDAVFFYSARTLSDPDIGTRFLKDLGARSMFLDELLRAAHPHFERSGTNRRFLRLVIDGVDEHPTDPNGLVSAIDAMVRQAAKYPWLKLVATVRSSFIERLPGRLRPTPNAESRYLTSESEVGDDLAYRLPPFSDELTASLAAKYRASGRNLGAVESLEGVGKRVLALPLHVRLLVEAGGELPENATQREIFSRWIDRTLDGETKDDASKRRFDLLRAFVRELDAMRTHAISHERLYEVESLRAAVVNAQVDSPYGQLLERGVLLEDRDDDRCFVTLRHPALLEHLLVDHHQPHMQSGEDLQELAVRAMRFASLEAAITEILLRSLRAGQTTLAIEALERCVPSADGQLRAELELLMRSIRDALVELLASRDAIGGELLATIAKGKLAAHSMVMSMALDEAARLGEEPLVEQIAKALLASTEGIEDPARRAQLELRLAKLAISKSDLEAAQVLYERASTHAGKANDSKARFRADLGRAKIGAMRGRADDAAALFDSSYAGLIAVGDTFDAAEARQNQAVLIGQKGDRDGAEKAAEEAKKLSHESGNARVEVRCLNMLAISADRRQEGALAEKLFLEALELATNRGLTELAASTHGSLGVLYHGRGDGARAETHLVRELELRREIGDKPPLARSLKRLAVLFAHRGDDAREEQYLLESLTLSAEVEDRAGVAEALGTLATLYEKRGDLDRVLELLKRALVQHEELGSKPEVAATLVKIANVSAEREDFDGAIASFTRALEIREAAADPSGVADCLLGLGHVQEARGDLDAAEVHYERALAIREELEDQDGISECISSIGGVMERRGDLAGAEESYRKALEIDLASDDALGAAFMFMLLGGVLYQQGQLGDAEEHAKRSVARFEELGHDAGLANALATLGVCRHMEGRLDEALECFTRELELRADQNDEDRRTYTLWLIASVELDRGNVERAMELRPEIARAIEKAQNPKHEAVLKVLDLRLAIHAGNEAEITRTLETAEAAFADAPGLPPLEDGLGTAYLEAAQHYDKRKQITRSKDLAMKAHEVVAGRPYNRQAELAAILPKLRRAPARPLRPVRPMKKPK